ncbi:Hsp70 family protein [Luedemannella helvata]|uniref:Molecular chaperone DnaK n=1 Tax=Luedemannella helvata TaxID=349315 RepID=A0ABN2JVG7_9ACTN
MTSSNDAYGIDFGTTNSVLARATAKTVEAVQLDTPPADWHQAGFDRVLPSVIGIVDGRPPVFGWEAKRLGSGRLEAVKRLFATDDTVTIGNEQLKVEEAAAIFFRHIQAKAAGAGFTSRLDQAVVTIPANSRGLARYRTKLSAGLAGIEVMALINEPTAAAMAHARAIRQNQRILVFDWGGGTLDVTVLQSFEGTFIEQSSKGIQRLGGLDIDTAFLASVLPRIPGHDSWTEEDRNRFRLNLELAKINLSSATVTQVPLPDGRGMFEVTRAQFEEAVRPLIQRTREPVDICLRESPGRIDHLVMVGGSSKMPVIQKFVAEIVGTGISDGVDPMTAIGEGAAIAAGILRGTITDLDFHVGTEHALGTIVHNDTSPKDGEFSVLIRRNTKYPASATDSYTPAVDFQEEVNIEVIEGDPAKPITHEDNVVLKQWSIKLPDKRLKADAAFDITYEYDVDGILHVLVKDQRTSAVIMDEELAFGAGQDRSQLPGMRRRVDGLMDRPGGGGGTTLEESPSTLSSTSRAALKNARDKVMPFVADADRQRLELLVNALENCEPEGEEAAAAALERELRHHAYLL